MLKNKDEKLDLDLNKDGVFDKEDKSLAARALATKLPKEGGEPVEGKEERLLPVVERVYDEKSAKALNREEQLNLLEARKITDFNLNVKEKELVKLILHSNPKQEEVKEEDKEKETPEEEKEEVKEGDKVAVKDISREYRAGSIVPAEKIAKWKECGIEYEQWF